MNNSINLRYSTVKDIFEMIPAENEYLTSCSTRDSNSDVMQLRDKSSCATNFQNAKYVLGSTRAALDKTSIRSSCMGRWSGAVEVSKLRVSRDRE